MMKRAFRALAAAALLGALPLAPAAAATVGPAYVLGPTSPGKWGPPQRGTGATVTWSIMGNRVSAGEHGPVTPLGNFMPSGYLREIERAFSAWSNVANITFRQVRDRGRTMDRVRSRGDIRIGGITHDGPGGQLAVAYFPPNNGGRRAGNILIDRQERWTIGTGRGGFDIFHLVTHEIGHAIGIDHARGPGALMSDMYSEAFQGLQPSDIAAAQALYGPRRGTTPIAWSTAPAGAGSSAGLHDHDHHHDHAHDGVGARHGVTVAPVPVPATLPLLAAAIGLLAWTRRRRAV